MTIEAMSEDNWACWKDGYPYPIYQYFVNIGLESSSDILGNCPSILSVQYVPFLVADDMNLNEIPYDVNRFGKVDATRPGLMSTPKVYRIRTLENRVKELAEVDCYKVQREPGKKSWKNESRLYNFPYSFAMINDGLNPPINLYYHLAYLFVKGNRIKIKVKMTLSDRCSYGIYVEGYKGDTNGYMESMVSTDAHELPCSSSAYSQWFATSKNQTKHDVQQASKQAFLSVKQARFDGVASAVGGLNIMNPIGSILNTATSLEGIKFKEQQAQLSKADVIGSAMAKNKDLQSTPNTMLSMGSDVVYGLDNSAKTLNLVRYGITPEYREKLANYFAMFGYKQNKTMVPNFRNRYYYNYIKTVGVNIGSKGVPRNHLEKIKGIFDKGVTVWHIDRDGVVVGDYSNDNFEVEE